MNKRKIYLTVGGKILKARLQDFALTSTDLCNIAIKGKLYVVGREQVHATKKLAKQQRRHDRLEIKKAVKEFLETQRKGDC